MNTDDPGISHITLAHEYQAAALAVGLSPQMIRQAQENALEMAFLSLEQKNAMLQRKQID